MIDVGVTLKVAAGKTGSHAVKWANKVVAYQKKSGQGPSTQSLLRPMTGEMHEIVFVSRWPSMAEYEDYYRKQRDDSEFAPLAKEMLESDWYLGVTRQIFDVVAE